MHCGKAPFMQNLVEICKAKSNSVTQSKLACLCFYLNFKASSLIFWSTGFLLLWKQRSATSCVCLSKEKKYLQLFWLCHKTSQRGRDRTNKKSSDRQVYDFKKVCWRKPESGSVLLSWAAGWWALLINGAFGWSSYLPCFKTLTKGKSALMSWFHSCLPTDLCHCKNTKSYQECLV